MRGIFRWPVNSPHKGPGTRQIFAFDHECVILWVIFLGCFVYYFFFLSTKFCRYIEVYADRANSFSHIIWHVRWLFRLKICFLSPWYLSGSYFINHLSLLIPIWQKFGFIVVVPIAKLHSDHLIPIWMRANEICIQFEPRWRNRLWNEPCLGILTIANARYLLNIHMQYKYFINMGDFQPYV